MTFGERLARRDQAWWSARRRMSLRERAHRVRERLAWRDRDTPDERWRCCPLWPRTLLDKWNGRELAARHGAPVARLLWRGRAPTQRLLDGLPADFVIRPVAGTSRRGVFVLAGDHELLRGGARQGLLAAVRREQPRTLLGRTPLLVEERIAGPAPGALPLELKCHTFAGRVVALQLLERTAAREGRHRWYAPDWTPYPERVNVQLPDLPVTDPPPGLARALALSERLGRATGTYFRIDWFLAGDGVVFNELSSQPMRGRYTPFGDELLGQAWQDHCPDAV